MPRFFRRRQVWLPTAWFALALLGLATLVVVQLGPGLAGVLGGTEPARGLHGEGARVLVIEGWLSQSDLEAAAATARSGPYTAVYTTGGRVDSFGREQPWPTYAERAAAYLQTQLAAGRTVTALPSAPSVQERTFLSAVAVRDHLQRGAAPVDAIDVYSSGVHARRTRMLYRLAFGPAVEIGILAAPPQDYVAEAWWRSSAGVKAVLGEVIGLAWTSCCFWPPAPPGSSAAAAPPRP